MSSVPIKHHFWDKTGALSFTTVTAPFNYYYKSSNTVFAYYDSFSASHQWTRPGLPAESETVNTTLELHVMGFS